MRAASSRWYVLSETDRAAFTPLGYQAVPEPESKGLQARQLRSSRHDSATVISSALRSQRLSKRMKL